MPIHARGRSSSASEVNCFAEEPPALVTQTSALSESGASRAKATSRPSGDQVGDILSRNPVPDWAAGWPPVHYVSDLEAAMRDAKNSAGDKNVLVHGSSIAQRAITAGLLDEIEIHLVPILFGEGRRLFEHLGVEQRELERIRVLEGEAGVNHLRYRITR